MKIPNGIDYRPKFHSVHAGSASSYTPCSYDRHDYSTEEPREKIFNFYGYESRTNKFPSKCNITNLTNPNMEERPDEPTVKGKHRVAARHGDILTIETERERHVVCVSGNSVYSLLSSTAEMSWPQEIKKILDTIPTEGKDKQLTKIKLYIIKKFSIDKNPNFPETAINTMVNKVYTEMTKNKTVFTEDEIAKAIWEMYPTISDIVNYYNW